MWISKRNATTTRFSRIVECWFKRFTYIQCLIAFMYSWTDSLNQSIQVLTINYVLEQLPKCGQKTGHVWG